MNHKSQPLMKSNGMAKSELHLPYTTGKLIDNAIECVTASIKKLFAGQHNCIAPIIGIKDLLKTLPKFPSCTNPSDQEFLHKLSWLNASNEIIISEIKRVNSLGIEIKDSLLTIKTYLYLYSSEDREQRDALFSLFMSMKKFVSEGDLEKFLLEDIEQTIFMYLPSSADGYLVDAIRILDSSFKQIIAEQNIQKNLFCSNRRIFRLILNKMQSCQTRQFNSGNIRLSNIDNAENPKSNFSSILKQKVLHFNKE